MKWICLLLFSILFFFGCVRKEDDAVMNSVPKAANPDTGSFVDHRTIELHIKAEDRLPESSGSTALIISGCQGHPIQPGDKKAERRLTPDTSVTGELRKIKERGSEIDVQEPFTRDQFLKTIPGREFASMIMFSDERSMTINFDNDILDNTDRYYTNGVRFDLVSPALRHSPISQLMLPYWHPAINYFGISIGQNMYTPSTTKSGGIHYNDRPYAACLIFSSFRISNDLAHKFRQTSQLDLGVIGPLSFGDIVQKSFHASVPTNNEPLGWEYQIQNDFLINYDLNYEKGILSQRHIEINVNAFGKLGTLYTNMGAGFQLRAGKFNPWFSSFGYSESLLGASRGYSKFQTWFFIRSYLKIVGYDATLLGGMFNKSNNYTLGYNDIIPFVYSGSTGLTISWEGIQIEAEQFLLSPEFHGCKWHKWVHVGLTFGI